MTKALHGTNNALLGITMPSLIIYTCQCILSSESNEKLLLDISTPGCKRTATYLNVSPSVGRTYLYKQISISRRKVNPSFPPDVLLAMFQEDFSQ